MTTRSGNRGGIKKPRKFVTSADVRKGRVDEEFAKDIKKSEEVTKPATKINEPIKLEPLSARQQAYAEHPKLTKAMEISTAVAAGGAIAAAAFAFLPVPTVAALGTRVGSILHTASIHHWSRQTGMLVAKKGITISRVPILEKAARVGQPAVNKLFQAATNLAARNVAINQKTTALATSALSKSFSTRALAIYGAWAGSVFLGKWGQAEAAEPITIPLRDALRQAQETGDWSIYDEYSEAANEIANVSMWENIISYSPFSAIPGILAKMKGVKKGIELIDAIAEKAKAEEAKKALEEPEPTFAEERATADEEARQRDLAEMQWKSEYYALIREGKFEEADALLQEEIKGI